MKLAIWILQLNYTKTFYHDIMLICIENYVTSTQLWKYKLSQENNYMIAARIPI